jgi:hypothetical protein
MARNEKALRWNREKASVATPKRRIHRWDFCRTEGKNA